MAIRYAEVIERRFLDPCNSRDPINQSEDCPISNENVFSIVPRPAGSNRGAAVQHRVRSGLTLEYLHKQVAKERNSYRAVT